MNIDDIVKQREKTHELYVELIKCFDQDCSENIFFFYSKLAAKMARICTENPNRIEHWKDIAFYSALAIETLEEKQQQLNSKTIDATQEVENMSADEKTRFNSAEKLFNSIEKTVESEGVKISGWGPVCTIYDASFAETLNAGIKESR